MADMGAMARVRGFLMKRQGTKLAYSELWRLCPQMSDALISALKRARSVYLINVRDWVNPDFLCIARVGYRRNQGKNMKKKKTTPFNNIVVLGVLVRHGNTFTRVFEKLTLVSDHLCRLLVFHLESASWFLFIASSLYMWRSSYLYVTSLRGRLQRDRALITARRLVSRSDLRSKVGGFFQVERDITSMITVSKFGSFEFVASSTAPWCTTQPSHSTKGCIEMWRWSKGTNILSVSCVRLGKHIRWDGRNPFTSSSVVTLWTEEKRGDSRSKTSASTLLHKSSFLTSIVDNDDVRILESTG